MEGRLAPDFEFKPLYLDRVYRGVGEAREMWADVREMWAEYRSEVEEVVDLGEYVLVVTYISGRGHGGGVPVDQRIVGLVRFEGEKALWVKSFTSKREALAAAGPSE